MTMNAEAINPTAHKSLGIGDWRQGIMFLCIGLMNVLWITPALYVFLTSAIMEDPLPMPFENMLYLLGANLLWGLVLRRTLIYYRIEFKQQQAPLLAGAVVAVLASVSVLPLLLSTGNNDLTFDYAAAFDINNELLADGFRILPIALILYSRGSTLGRNVPPPSIITVQSRLGIGMFFLTAIVSNNTLQDEMTSLLPMFFATILLASALSRAATLKLSSEVRNQRFSGSWFALLLLTTFLVTGAGFIVALLFGAIDDEQLRRALELPLTIALGLIVLILSPFAYVITWLLGQIPDPPPEESNEEIVTGTREVVASQDNPQIDIGDEIRAVYDLVANYLPFIIMAGIALLVLYFWLSYFLSPETQQLDDEESESIDERESIAKLNLGKQLRKLGDSLNKLAQAGLGRDLFATFTIRWAYSRMERLGRKRGYTRHKSQTPYEYRIQLYRAFPNGDHEVRTITNAYVAVRYGERPEDNLSLEEVREALEKLKTIPPPESP